MVKLLSKNVRFHTPVLMKAIQLCLETGNFCQVAKSDLISAFRHLCIRKEDWHLLVMKAECPLDGRTYYFVDKCLPFGHALSCALFQKVSDAISFLTKARTLKRNVNYLDDYFFAGLNRLLCNFQVDTFMQVCWRYILPSFRRQNSQGLFTANFPWIVN